MSQMVGAGAAIYGGGAHAASPNEGASFRHAQWQSIIPHVAQLTRHSSVSLPPLMIPTQFLFKSTAMAMARFSTGVSASV